MRYFGQVNCILFFPFFLIKNKFQLHTITQKKGALKHPNLFLRGPQIFQSLTIIIYLYLPLASSAAPTIMKISWPKIRPLAHASISQCDSPSFSQFGHHICISRHDWAKQCKLNEPAVVFNISLVAILSLSKIGIPCNRDLWPRCPSLAVIVCRISLV